MPLSQTVVPNPAFKPENAVEKAAFEKALARGPVVTYAINAKEILRHPRTMYMPKPEGPDRTVKHEFDVDLNAMTNLQLIQYSASLGRSVKKGMKKSDLIDLIQKWQEDIAAGVIDDDEE